jgi:DNA-binding IclR family transcriptional regulator
MDSLHWFISIHKRSELSATQLRLLCEIGVRNSSRLTANRLAELTGIHPQTIYGALRELVSMGYVAAGRLTERGCFVLGLQSGEYLAGRVMPP